MKHIKKCSFMGVVILIGGIALWSGISLFDAYYRTTNDAGMIIAHDIERLKDIFHRIHYDCGILDFDAQKNPINFLNVKNFSGSEVGPMNLSYPDKWCGPYLDHNPTVYHIAYQVVSTKNGYFVTPGDGVLLPNKKVIGQDIILDKKADIAKMMTDSDWLAYNNIPLAARLDLGTPINIQFFFNEDDE